MKAQASWAFQAEGGMAGLCKPVLRGAQEVAILGIDERQTPLGKVQQGSDMRRHVHKENVGLHTVVEQLKPAAVVPERRLRVEEKGRY